MSPHDDAEARAHFPFLDGLKDEVAALLRIKTADKLAALDKGARFLTSEEGQSFADQIVGALVEGGYPEAYARLEVSLLVGFLSSENLSAIVDNPAALRGGRAWLDGEFIEVAPGVAIGAFPAGPLLIVSRAALAPAIVVAVDALLASCPVALRGSRVNQPAIERFFAALRAAGDATLDALIDKVHTFCIDHEKPDEATRLDWLLRHGPFAAGTFWGGREVLDELVRELGQNPAHPLAIPMEPVTGVALVTERHLDSGDPRAAARSLAEAMVVMRQQLCSSPTEGYFVGAPAAAEAFARLLAAELDRIGGVGDPHLSDGQALLLDRVRGACEEAGSTVLVPAAEDASWTLVVSHGESVFPRLPRDLALSIHARSGFLELIALPDLEAAALLIRALPGAPCHGDIQKVQTILRIAGLDEVKRLMVMLRGAGGIYRAVPPEYVARRHALEPLDGQHLLSLLTRQMVTL